MKEILSSLDEIEMIVIRATALIGVIIVCFLVLRHHVKSFSEGARKRKRSAKDKRLGEDRRNIDRDRRKFD